MAAGPQVLSGAGSLGANTVLLLALAASVASLPQLRYAKPESRHGGHGWYEPLNLWGPYIEPVEGGESGPRCPSPAASAKHMMLVHAPLPEGFDTSSKGAGPHHVCVRVDRNARVREVQAKDGSAPALADMALRQWRFRPHLPGSGPGWHRVRVKRPAGGDV